MMKETINGYLRTNSLVAALEQDQRILLRRILESFAVGGSAQDGMPKLAQLIAFCSASLNVGASSQKQLARIANKALEIMLAR